MEKTKIKSLLADMAHNNILYYDPVETTFTPQGKSLEWGIKLYFEEMK